MGSLAKPMSPTAYLIDSSVFIAQQRGAITGQEIAARIGDSPFYISVITVTELLHGVERSDSAMRRDKNSEFVESILSETRVLPIDTHIARVHARIWADLRQRGQLIGAHDMLIAATALAHRATVLTHNTRHFARIESLAVESWKS